MDGWMDDLDCFSSVYIFFEGVGNKRVFIEIRGCFKGR